jgi:predicted metal-dependent peptidase
MQEVQITPAQLRKWEDAVSMMTFTAPGFLHLLYKLLNAQNNTSGTYVCIFSEDVPTAATDSINIIVNPKFYLDTLSLAERVFVLGHEILHNVFNDVALLHRCRIQNHVLMPEGDKLAFDSDVMQIAMDARINALLIESKIGKPPEAGVYDKKVKGTDSVYPIYRRYLQEKQQGKKPGNQPGNQPGGQGDQPRPNQGTGEGQVFDDLLKPGQATGQKPQDAVNQRSEQRWAVELEVARQMEMTRTQGRMAGSLAIMFRNLLEPEVHWLDHIETMVKRVTGDGSVDWYQPNPWLGHNEYFVPADTGLGSGWIVVWGDTSGSVNNDRVQARYISEMAGLMEQANPRRLTIVWADAKVQNVEEITDPAEMRNVKPKGGGGTDYSPVLKWIRDNGNGELPDLLIAFTDGEVSHGKETPYPVIWACNTDKAFPWGQVVRIKQKEVA